MATPRRSPPPKKQASNAAIATKAKKTTGAAPAPGIEARMASGLSRMRAEFQKVRARVQELRNQTCVEDDHTPRFFASKVQRSASSTADSTSPDTRTEPLSDPNRSG